MNYIKLIVQFWTFKRSNNVSPTQAYLYFCLLQECNIRNWPKSFQCSNQLICATLGITEKSLIEARKRLKEFGLIEFDPGITKSKSPTYYLLDNCKKVSNDNSNEVSNQEVITTVIPTVITTGKTGTYKNKQNLNNINNNSGEKPVTNNEKNNSEKFLYWKKITDTWFRYYETKTTLKPTFDGASAKALKKIIEGLKKISEQKNIEWSEDNADRSFTNFLSKAYQDEWLRSNFLLNILASKFDVIVNPMNNGTIKRTGRTEPSIQPATVEDSQTWG